MLRFSVALVAMLAIMPSASAADGDKHLSVALSVGANPDMASLGSTITQDGTVDTASTTLANLAYATDKALMSDRDNLAVWHNSQHTDSSFQMLGQEPVRGGALLGLELGGHVQYELDALIPVPLWVRAGFQYDTRISGGHQERVLGDVAARNPDIAALLQANGEDPADYIGGTMITDYDASWFEVPITVGVKVPVKRAHTFAYAGAGLSFFQGGFSVAMDVDEEYANVLATHVDTEDLTVTNLSPGAVQDEIDFRIGGAGLNWQVGAQAGLGAGLALFVEAGSSGGTKTVLSSVMKPETRQLLTATSSQSLAESDDQWFKRLAFPVVTTGASFRAGLRYYFF